MGEDEWLAERFESDRQRLRGVALRILGSASEADDAVQEAWLHVSRADTGAVENLGAWLTTVVARVCLDMLRSRKARREEPLDAEAVEPIVSYGDGSDPEDQALLADSVGLSLLVVLEKLAPAERLAFVLHDMFAVPYDEIGPILGRSPTAARQLASRGRRRVQGLTAARGEGLAHQRQIVEAFLAASRAGDFKALLAVLDPDVVARADAGAVPAGATREVRGAQSVVDQARTFARRAPYAQLALVNGTVGLIVAPRGHLWLALAFKFSADRIAEIDVIADPERLRRLDLAFLDE